MRCQKHWCDTSVIDRHVDCAHCIVYLNYYEDAVFIECFTVVFYCKDNVCIFIELNDI